MILLPCPVRPDLDCLAGALGYAEYLRHQGKTAKAWLCGTPDGEAQFYLDLFRNDITFATADEINQAQSYILVDFSDIRYIPSGIDAAQVIEVIDHRDFTTPHQDFPNARIQIDPVGAAATQIAEFFMRANLRPSLTVASMLYGAIYSNTLCLQGQLCSACDTAAAQWLKSVEPSADAYTQQQLQARKQETLSNFPNILSVEMKIGENNSGKFGISQLEMMEATEFFQAQRQVIMDHLSQYDFPVYLGMIDLSTNTSLLYFSDNAFKEKLQNHPALAAIDNNVATFRPAQMRKQIIPVILQ